MADRSPVSPHRCSGECRRADSLDRRVVRMASQCPYLIAKQRTWQRNDIVCRTPPVPSGDEDGAGGGCGTSLYKAGHSDGDILSQSSTKGPRGSGSKLTSSGSAMLKPRS